MGNDGAGESAPEARPGAMMRRVRSLLLAIAAVGVLGLGAELVLLKHWESPLEWSPFVVLAAAIPLLGKVWLRPGPRSVLALRAVMAGFVLVALVGFWSHWRSNLLLELEMNTSLEGWPLLLRTLHGGTPFLAPGALLQIGFVGLLGTFRHPALRR